MELKSKSVTAVTIKKVIATYMCKHTYVATTFFIVLRHPGSPLTLGWRLAWGARQMELKKMPATVVTIKNRGSM